MSAAQRWVVLLLVYCVFFLIALTSILAVAGFLPNVDEGFRKVSVGLLAVDIAGVCVVVFRTQFSKADEPARVNVAFPSPPPTSWDDAKCEYVIFTNDSREKSRGAVMLQREPAGWSCRLPVPADATDLARFRLVEASGVAWEVPAFSPNVINVSAQPTRGREPV